MNFDHERVVVYKNLARFFGLNPPVANIGYFIHYNEEFKTLLNELKRLELIIAGGTIISAFTANKINDLDFYMKDPSKADEIQEFLLKTFNHGEPFYSENAVTYKRKAEGSNKVYTVQLIKAFSGTPEEVMDWFDFTITQGAFDFTTNEFVLGKRFLADNAKRTLVFCGKSKYPICALYRTKKYMERGYTCPGSTLMHIALGVVQLDIRTYADLKKQLMGVDTMYLQGLLSKAEYDEKLPVDYGKFVSEVFDYMSGIQSPDPEANE